MVMFANYYHILKTDATYRLKTALDTIFKRNNENLCRVRSTDFHSFSWGYTERVIGNKKIKNYDLSLQ